MGNSKISPTIDTIAALYGCSRTTVSAVLRGQASQYRIAPATEASIRETAEKEGWKPNFFARSLNRKQTATIGVLFPDVFEHFMGETIRGIETVLQEANLRMLLSTSRFNPEEELRAVEAFRYRGIDGLIIVPYTPFTGSYSRSVDLPETIGSLPCVVLDRIPDGMDPSSASYGFVYQADYDGAYRATRLLATDLHNPLVSQTYKRVAYISFDLAASSIRHRLLGYRAAISELGMKGIEILLQEQNPEASDLTEALDRIDRGPKKPEAYLVSTAGLADKLAAILSSRGHTIGDDVYIARFGMDPPWIRTGLIGIRQPHREMGMRGAELLLKLVESRFGNAQNLPNQLKAQERTIELPLEILLPTKTKNCLSVTFIHKETSHEAE